MKRILVFLGGSDPNNVTQKALEALLKVGFLGVVDVVVGTQNPFKREIRAICERSKNYSYYCQVDNIAELMIQADLAISAGGSTTWERCCLGLPSIVICTGDNEKELIKNAADIKIIHSIDSAHEVISSNKLAEVITRFLTNCATLADMSARAIKFVDGLGVERVYSELCSYR